MASEIEITRQEALDLLRKWMAEKRVIHFSLKTGEALAKVVGRIDAIVNGKVHLSSKKTTFPLGMHYLAEFSLDKCTFEYSDAKDAPDWLRTKLAGHDALLYIYYFDNSTTLRYAVGLDVLPIEEWAQF